MKNIIWLASYPKSGNTWLRAFTGALFGLEPISEQGRFAAFSTQCNARDAFQAAFAGKTAPKTDGTLEWRQPFQRQLSENVGNRRIFCKTHCRYSSQSGEDLFAADVALHAILIVRNPIDVCASLTNHFGVGVPVALNMINNPDAAMARNSTRNFEAPLGDWSSFTRSWLEQSDIPLSVMRYEDMFFEPEKRFGAFAAKVMGIRDPEKIAAAVKASAFDNLKERETRFGFDEKPGGAERFFWKGRPYHGLDMLDSAAQKAVWLKHGQMAERIGYRFENGQISLAEPDASLPVL